MRSRLYLVRTRIDARALNIFAARTGTLDDDLGYALHLALRRRFGAAAPQPFRVLEAEPHDPNHPRLLGYAADPSALDLPLPLPDLDADDWSGDPGLADVFPQPFEAKAMPAEWREKTRLHFEVLVRPIRRHGPKARAARREAGRVDGLGRSLRTGTMKRNGSLEFDAFELAVETFGRDDLKPSRAEVYTEWLDQRLGNAACLCRASTEMLRFRRSRVVRTASSRAGGKGETGLGHRARHRALGIEGPEALMSGIVDIKDGPAFSELLAKGVGRHCAFGMGMLLLRPV